MWPQVGGRAQLQHSEPFLPLVSPAKVQPAHPTTDSDDDDVSVRIRHRHRWCVEERERRREKGRGRPREGGCGGREAVELGFVRNGGQAGCLEGRG